MPRSLRTVDKSRPKAPPPSAHVEGLRVFEESLVRSRAKMDDSVAAWTQDVNAARDKAFARRLQARGCRLALDDFGAGFGSFYYLKALPFDYFKIDGDFIRDIVSSPMDQLVVGAIVGIAKGMGKKTIAEFVADDDTTRLLVASGVDYAQGYHVGRPRPVQDVLHLA